MVALTIAIFRTIDFQTKQEEKRKSQRFPSQQDHGVEPRLANFLHHRPGLRSNGSRLDQSRSRHAGRTFVFDAIIRKARSIQETTIAQPDSNLSSIYSTTVS